MNELLNKIIEQQRILEKVQINTNIVLAGTTINNIAKYTSIQEKVIKNATLFNNSFSSQVLNLITQNNSKFNNYIQTTNTIANIIQPSLSKYFIIEDIVNRFKQKNITSFDYLIGTEFENFDDKISDIVKQVENNENFKEKVQHFSENYINADENEKQELISILIHSTKIFFKKYKTEIIIGFIEILIGIIISINISNQSTKEINKNQNQNTERIIDNDNKNNEELEIGNKENTEKTIQSQEENFEEAKKSRLKYSSASKEREDEILKQVKYQKDYITSETKLYSKQKTDSSFVIIDLKKYTEIRMIDRKTKMSLIEIIETKQKGWVQNKFLKDFE